MKPNNKSFGFNNIEPARNSTVFLPHIPGKNYENPSEIDEMTLFGSGTFDDAVLSDKFTYEFASAESASAVSASAVSASASSAIASSSSASSASASCASVSSASASSVTVSSASAQSSSASSSCNKRKRGPEPKSIGQLVPGPSYCATKKKPVSRPLSSRLAVITYPVKTYKKPWQPKQVPLAASGSSGGPTSGPIANVSAAIACSSFTLTEYAKKVKALELLTGQRVVSVNPFCKIVVTGIEPMPFRLVKKGLIDLSILVCKVVNIQFVGKTTEFTIYKSYKGTFLYKLASNPLITVISS
ncbi:hypothetical protein AYI70_g10842 [Smittium culicis]|uniref:Uncharacterized protein n=1 Tax=Smittium culicis TaxID=133412 RepID=A0A1R1X4L1_9FUNG|nr:hypothetical protein AYI70_g10842 [Smittium culicis]